MPTSRTTRLMPLIAGFLAGLVAGACATSDQMLEKRRRLEEIGGGPGNCRAGVTEDCYTGPDGTAGRGACKMGRRSCKDGAWGECEEQILPSQELCNNIDDDCDGIVDNGFERDGALCFFAGAKGACRTQGRWHCSEDGKTSTCDAPVVKPTEEICDGIDNDCDGEIDEDSVPAAERQCTTGKAGVCNAGTRTCVNGRVRCVQNVKPGVEICNKLDDNCNNEVDEDCISAEEAKKIGSPGG